MWPEPKPGQPLLRPHFSPRQLVTAADLNAGVDYLVERMRRHNRFLHGCGIVCGMEVTVEVNVTALMKRRLIFTVSEGAAIGPQGDMIVIPKSDIRIMDQVRTDTGITSTALSELILSSREDSLPIYLLVRHKGESASNSSTWPDDCHRSNDGPSPTRVIEDYEFELSTVLPASCASASPSLCGLLLDRNLPDRETALTGLPACREPAKDDVWLVVCTVSVWRDEELGLFYSELHYRDRTLLPSARALLELLSCFPEAPRIDSVTLTNWQGWYVARLKGYGFAGLRGVEVDNLASEWVIVDTSQTDDREMRFVFSLTANTSLPATYKFTIETVSGAINSEDWGVYLNVTESVPNVNEPPPEVASRIPHDLPIPTPARVP